VFTRTVAEVIYFTEDLSDI